MGWFCTQNPVAQIVNLFCLQICVNADQTLLKILKSASIKPVRRLAESFYNT